MSKRGACWIATGTVVALAAASCAGPAPVQMVIGEPTVLSQFHRASSARSARHRALPTAWCLRSEAIASGHAWAAPADPVVRGYRAFDRVCGRCHPDGEEDVGPRLVGLELDPEAMWSQIREGGGRMSAVPASCMPDAAVADAMAYLRAIRATR